MKPNPARKSTALKRHLEMVADPYRTPILEKAVKGIVRRGDAVFDLGCGTGPLTLAALKAQARVVYACDIDKGALKAARELVKRAGFAHRVHFFEGLSSQIKLPEKVDVILSETVGSLAFNENILPFLLDARQRFLKPGGRILPQKLALYAAPCALASGQKSDRLKKIKDHPFEIRAVTANDLLGNPQKIFEADFSKNRWTGFDEERLFRLSGKGILSSFAGWFEAHWAPGCVTSTTPKKPQTHWKQALLPVDPLPVKKGELVGFRLRLGLTGAAFAAHPLIEWGSQKM